MTSPKADSDSPAPLEDGGLDEERITTALLRLQEMHLQLRNLRQNIRLIVQPLHTEYSSPQALYAAFSQNANGAVNNVRGFTKLLEDSESQNALSRARESREKDNGGIMGWLVTQHEDWLDDVGEKGEKTGGDQVNNTDRTGADGEKEEDVTAILGKFQEEHSDVQVERQEGGSAIKACIPPPARLNFQIEIKAGDQGHCVYGVQCEGNSHLHKAVTRAIVSRSKPDDLRYLLAMLASYSDIKTRRCEKCNALLDSNAQFPVERVRTGSKTTNGEIVDRWEALHTECL